jgi:hypothetical protein
MHCRRDQRGLVAAALREIFNTEAGEQAKQRVTSVLERLTAVAPKVCQLLEAAGEDLTAFYAFPSEHWTKLRSTNPLERVSKEIGRRSDVVSDLPQQRLGDPSRRRTAVRAERRVAGATPLPLRRVDGARCHRPRHRSGHRRPGGRTPWHLTPTTRRARPGGDLAPHGLSRRLSQPTSPNPRYTTTSECAQSWRRAGSKPSVKSPSKGERPSGPQRQAKSAAPLVCLPSGGIKGEPSRVSHGEGQGRGEEPGSQPRGTPQRRGRGTFGWWRRELGRPSPAWRSAEVRRRVASYNRW